MYISKLAGFLRILICISMAGCATMTDVPGWPKSAPSDEVQVALVPGDKLLVSTRTEGSVSIVVTAIESDALVGYTEDRSQTRRIEFSEITKMQRKSHPIARTIDGFGAMLAFVGYLALPWLIVAVITP